MRASDRLIVALDVAGADEARRLVTMLGAEVTFYKVGLELFMGAGAFDLVHWLADAGKRVFVDVKLFDIPQTVRRAVERLTTQPVDFLTVHGNDAVMQAAAEVKGEMKILAVTVLTSLDRGDLADLGFDCDVETLVVSRARRALGLGCDGVVSSAAEAGAIRAAVGSRLLVVTPGIRPVDNRDDQKRTVTVPSAFEAGADHIVVGRPIRDAADPRAAAAEIQRQIASTLETLAPG